MGAIVCKQPKCWRDQRLCPGGLRSRLWQPQRQIHTFIFLFVRKWVSQSMILPPTPYLMEELLIGNGIRSLCQFGRLCRTSQGGHAVFTRVAGSEATVRRCKDLVYFEMVYDVLRMMCSIYCPFDILWKDVFFAWHFILNEHVLFWLLVTISPWSLKV